MAIITNTVSYLDGDTVLEGFFAFDDAIEGQRPLVLVSHAWAGRSEFTAKKAIKLAELGYVGFALDMYGKGKLGKCDEECSALMRPFVDNRILLQQRIKAALAAARLLSWVDATQVAAIGFCFGGLCVLDLARTCVDIKGVVSFHGLLHAPKTAVLPQINAKILVLHGHDDPLVPPEQVHAFQKEMTEASADWQLHSYGHTVHSFTNPQASDFAAGYKFCPTADHRAWQAMQNFLTEIFRLTL
jgi:dienelactone hydrolase